MTSAAGTALWVGELTLQLSDADFAKLLTADSLAVMMGGAWYGTGRLSVTSDFKLTIRNKSGTMQLHNYNAGQTDNGFTFNWIIPEPSSVALGLLAVVGCAGRRRREC